MKELKEFRKKNDYLLCIDSDGCAIDGMNVKHKECFGPSLVEEWQLQQYQTEILNYWNKINLYSMTRGINRFKGLLLALDFINEAGYAKVDTTRLKTWIATTNELSNKRLRQEIETEDDMVLKKAFSWSELVNKKVEMLPSDKKVAFIGVKEVLKEATPYADIVIVSSANSRAVEEEWGANDILDYADAVMTQENGSKTDCIKQILALGYNNKNVLMIGDAPGDLNAAKDCDVLFYPILVDKEAYSWIKFKDIILELFLQNKYDTTWMEDCVKEFKDNLLTENR